LSRVSFMFSDKSQREKHKPGYLKENNDPENKFIFSDYTL